MKILKDNRGLSAYWIFIIVLMVLIVIFGSIAYYRSMTVKIQTDQSAEIAPIINIDDLSPLAK